MAAAVLGAYDSRRRGFGAARRLCAFQPGKAWIGWPRVRLAVLLVSPLSPRLRSRRLSDETLPMAAAAARAGLHPRQGHRALPVHLDPALRNRLDAAPGRGRHVPA